MIDEPLNEMGLMRVQISNSYPVGRGREIRRPRSPIIIIINDGISIRRSAENSEGIRTTPFSNHPYKPGFTLRTKIMDRESSPFRFSFRQLVLSNI